MVMGPTHAMSGAAAWLAAVAGGLVPGLAGAPIPVVLAGTAVAAGSALLPDLDCPGSLSTKDGSTVVRAFGWVGEIVGHSLTSISLGVYNLTASKFDKPRTNGHRTLTHTLAFTAGLGAVVSWAGSLTTEVSFAGQDWLVAHVVTWIAMFACLHLAMFGLAEKWVKKQRAKFGLIPLLVISAIGTSATISHLPDTGLPWLGLAVGGGAVMHLFGDAITKMGVPILWPIPIHGKRWWDVTLPSMLRITAGGGFEKTLLLPGLSLATIVLLFALLPGGQDVLVSLSRLG